MLSFSVFIRRGGEYDPEKGRIVDDHRIWPIWHISDTSVLDELEAAHHETLVTDGRVTIYKYLALEFPLGAYGIDSTEVSPDDIIWVEIWDES